MRRPSEPVTAWRRAQAATTKPASCHGTAAPTDRLRTLAGCVRRLGLGGRFDPEQAFLEREVLAQALHGLAREIEHAAGHVPPPAQARSSSAAPSPAPSRRTMALLTAQAGEIQRLQALLAQAARPGRRRRRSANTHADQLQLPLPEDRHGRG